MRWVGASQWKGGRWVISLLVLLLGTVLHSLPSFGHYTFNGCVHSVDIMTAQVCILSVLSSTYTKRSFPSRCTVEIYYLSRIWHQNHLITIKRWEKKTQRRRKSGCACGKTASRSPFRVRKTFSQLCLFFFFFCVCLLPCARVHGPQSTREGAPCRLC